MTKFDDKLKGLPPIFYLNMDHRTERKEHLESEFSKWGITDYTGYLQIDFILQK